MPKQIFFSAPYMHHSEINFIFFLFQISTPQYAPCWNMPQMSYVFLIRLLYEIQPAENPINLDLTLNAIR